jgi:hypothetical protein
MEWICFAKSVSAVVCEIDYGRRGKKVVAAGYHAKNREPPEIADRDESPIAVPAFLPETADGDRLRAGKAMRPFHPRPTSMGGLSDVQGICGPGS